tara:strand:- start:7612 stop:10482 length:2871 start_codon:yes stop_codon:yes gene_type:complete
MADQKGPQAKIYEKINRQLGVTQKLLRDQAVLHETINAVLRDGIESASDAGERVDVMLKKQGVSLNSSFSQTARDHSRMAAAIEKQGAEMADKAEGDSESLIAKGKAALAYIKNGLAAGKDWTDEGMIKAQNLLKAQGGELIGAYQEIQKEVGGNVLGGIEGHSNDMTSFLISNMNRLREVYASETDASGLAYKARFSDFSKFVGNIDSMAKRGLVAYQILQVGAEAALDANRDIGQGLGLTSDEIAELQERSLSRTGKVNSIMLQEMATYAKILEKETGIASKDMGQAMSELIRDSDSFANLTVKNAARAAGAIGKIGMSVEQLSNSMSGFDGFEKSVESASTLQSVFGGVLDPIDMMFKAKNDPGGALMGLQQWFKTTGLDIKTLGAYGKDLIKDVIPGLDIPTMERLFADGAGPEEIAALAKSLEGVETLGPEDAVKKLSGDFELVKTGAMDSSDAIETFLEGALIKLAPEATKVSLAFDRFNQTLPVKALETSGTALKTFLKITDKDLAKMTKDLGGLGDGFVTLFDKVGKLDFKNSMDPLLKAIEKLAKSAVKGIIGYFKEASGPMKKIFTEWGTWLGEAFKAASTPNSPLPPIQAAILKYMNKTAKGSVEGFNKAFEPKNFTSLKDFQGAMKEAVAGKETKGALKKFVSMTDDELKNLEAKVKEGKFDIGSFGMPFKRFDISTDEGFQGLSEKANKQLQDSMFKLTAQVNEGPLSSVNAVYDKMTEMGSPLASMIGSLKEAKVPFDKLTDSTKTMLKDLGNIKDDDLLRFAYDGGDEMSKFKKDFGHIEDKLNLLKEGGRGLGNLSVRQQRDMVKSLKKMGIDSKEITAAMSDQTGASVKKIIDDQKERLVAVAKLNEEKAKESSSSRSDRKSNKGSRDTNSSGLDSSLNRSMAKLTKAINAQNTSQGVQMTAVLKLGNDQIRLLVDKVTQTTATDGSKINATQAPESKQ